MKLITILVYIKLWSIEMFNRCKECGEKCPDYSDMCNTCKYIQCSEEILEEDEDEVFQKETKSFL